MRGCAARNNDEIEALELNRCQIFGPNQRVEAAPEAAPFQAFDVIGGAGMDSECAHGVMPAAATTPDQAITRRANSPLTSALSPMLHNSLPACIKMAPP